MITTGRSENESYFGHQNGIDLLERKADSYKDFTSTEVEESLEDAKARMERNLQRLLNYDKYQETTEEKVENDEVKAELSLDSNDTASNEDISPSSTTMQFGMEQADELFAEMNEKQVEKYSLTKKGKVVVFLYAMAISVIFALIVLNTGVLAVLSRENIASSQILNSKIEEYNTLKAEIENISSEEYILNIAENEYGMVS